MVRGGALLGSGIRVVAGGRGHHSVTDHDHGHDHGDDEHDAAHGDDDHSHHVHSQTLTQVPGAH